MHRSFRSPYSCLEILVANIAHNPPPLRNGQNVDTLKMLRIVLLERTSQLRHDGARSLTSNSKDFRYPSIVSLITIDVQFPSTMRGVLILQGSFMTHIHVPIGRRRRSRREILGEVFPEAESSISNIGNHNPMQTSAIKIHDKNPPNIIQTVAIRLNQQERELYLFTMKAAQVHSLIESGKLGIDRWSPTSKEGYQRVPIDSRYKKFGRFVAISKGISPVSILISLRDKNALEIRPLDGVPGAVSLKVKGDAGTLYIPDGQHRAYGLGWAVDQYPGQCENYEIPVVLFVADGDDPRYEEAHQFYTINQNAKRVRTDLAQRYLLRTRERELGELDSDVAIPHGVSIKQLDPYAVKIADLVNSNGPLEGRVEPPNMSIPTASISQNSFVESLRPLLLRAAEARWTIGKAEAVLTAYWNAVRSKCPEAFQHWHGDPCDKNDARHFDAVLVTTAGIFSLNDILARSLLLPAVSAAPTSPETFRKILDKPTLEDFFSDGEDGYWSSKAQGASSHGTGRKSFKEIADDIWESVVESQ